jgi:hypothetical protein
MQVYGKIKQDDPTARSVRKGNTLPPDAEDGDIFTLLCNDGDNCNQETPYIRRANEWVQLILDGDYIDAGTY